MTAWPAVTAALVELLPTLPGFADVAVYDGPPVTDARPLLYVTVGYVEDDDAGSYSTTRRNDFRVEETGTVRCHFVAQSGAADLPGVRADVFALVAALDEALAADQTLGGVLSEDGTSDLTAEVRSVQNSNGSAQSVVVTIAYLTRR